MNHLKKFENFLNESDINDPVLILSRAKRMDAQLKKEEEKKRASKRVYGKKRDKLEEELAEISVEIKDLYSEKSQTFKEQDMEAGEKGEKWSDEDANRYGKILNDIDDKLVSLLKRRNEIEIKLSY